MNCPLEPDIKTFEKCSACYASMGHVPCPADLENPIFLAECRNTTPEKLQFEHPEWNLLEIFGTDGERWER